MAWTREDWLRTEMWTGRDQRGDFFPLFCYTLRSNAVAWELLGQQEGLAGVLAQHQQQHGYFTLDVVWLAVRP
jgi:hypothetical protein